MRLNKTRIEWVINPDRTPGYTWNIVTGCLHDCPYCYAKTLSRRFEGRPVKTKTPSCTAHQYIVKEGVPGEVVDVQLRHRPGFLQPTFWKDKLSDPLKIKNPSTFFVSSMGDLFGEWVPIAWIEQVLDTVHKCPQHTFLFLTKNGSKMGLEGDVIDTENAWYGQTCTGVPDRPIIDIYNERQFLSFEPLLGDWVPDLNWIRTNWVIIGSLNRNGEAVHPNNGGTKKEWALKVIKEAEKANKPIFIKSELLRLYPDLPQKKDIPYLKR